MIIVVMGVMGVGKSTVGAALASRLGWRFIEGDDFHDEASWLRLEQGKPLSDAEREPWLARLQRELAATVGRGESAVLACSALRGKYRRALVPPGVPPETVRFVYLDADATLIAARLAQRKHHRAAPALLASQFDTLEIPGDALSLPAAETPARLIEAIIDKWSLTTHVESR